MRTARVIVFALLALLASSSTVQAAELGSQSWYLEPGHLALKVEPSGTKTNIKLNNSQSIIWRADSPALVDVPLDGTWAWEFEFTNNELSPNRVELRVGKLVGPSGVFQSAGTTGVITITGNSATKSGTGVATPGFVVNEGETLAFEIINTADLVAPPFGAAFSVRQHSPDTRFISPQADPGYPTPELSTIVLVGIGLVVVAAVALRRK